MAEFSQRPVLISEANVLLTDRDPFTERGFVPHPHVGEGSPGGHATGPVNDRTEVERQPIDGHGNFSPGGMSHPDHRGGPNDGGSSRGHKG